MDAVGKAISSFSCELLKELLKAEKNKNVCFSPVGTCAMLKMAMIGAGGNTKSEMEQVLHAKEECPTKDCPALPASIKELLSGQTGQKYELRAGNGLFAEMSIAFRDQYLQHLKEEFSVEPNPADFKHKADAERLKINEWVKCVTHGRIMDMFPKDSFNESSVLALVNAMYFKGQWAVGFNPENTKEGTFNVNKKEKKTVPMMSQIGKCKHAAVPEIESKVLILQYQGDLSMIIVLPNEIEGIIKVVPKITHELLANWFKPGMLKETDLEMHIPKFSAEGNYDLKSCLMAMGMKDLFQVNADLSGMSDAKGLSVSRVAQKCCIEVNEEGAEAAAATGAGVSATSPPVPAPEPFIVNHPFMFCLVQNKDCLPLFTGAVFSP